MSTHVDGAAPSVAPDPDDGEPDRQQSGLDDGSQWVRAEIQRRIAVNRSTRGRHARRGDAAAPSGDAPVERGARERPRRGPVTPASGSSPQTIPLPPPGFVAAGDLPENYVPRHSVQTPGPAAEPAAPISGPIPIVRPVPAGTEAPSAPVGGPSLPPSGVSLPVRKKRSGPGAPLPGGGGAAGPWSRPGASIVPHEPVQRLGAPPGMLGGAEPLPSWGVPASPPRGFAAAPVPVQAEPGPGTDDDGRTTGDEVGIAGPAGGVTDYRDYPDYPDDSDDDASTAEDPVDGARAGEANAADTAAGGGAVEHSPVEHSPVEHSPGEHSPTEGGATEEQRALSEVTTTILPVVDGPTVHAGVPPPARLVGIPVQRASVPTRAVAPRPMTPRNIPVVGTAPPEPGSTRVRVVLSERKGVARPVRTIKEVQEGTPVGEMLRRDLIRSQLMVTLRFGALAVLVLGTLPAILALFPAVGQFHVAGLRVPWLLLGVLMYPFLVGVAWRYTRVADRVEQNFADHVQD